MSLFSVSQIRVRCEERSEPPLTSSDLKFAQKKERRRGGECRFEDEKKHKIWGRNQAEDTFSSPAAAKRKKKERGPGPFLLFWQRPRSLTPQTQELKRGE